MSGSQQLLLGGIPTVTPVDPYFYSVTSLLHGDGTNGGQNNTFLDSSTNNFSITRNGNTTQGSFSPFSQTGWSNYFDGNGDYLSIADNVALDLGTGDFTIEGWAYFSAAGSDGDGLISKRDDPAFTNGAWRVAWDATNRKINIACADEGTTRSTPAVSLHSWVHFAFVRSGSTLNCYANGVLGDQDASWGHNLNNAYTLLIGTNVVGSNFLTGYLSNIRILKGTAVYSGATYTVPTTPLTAITNTSLLTCQANRFLDASSNNFTITRNGDVSVQPFSPFNPTTAYSTSAVGGSGYFDGSGDYLSMTSGTSLGSGDFTIGCWVYLTAAPGAETPVGSSYNYFTSGQNGNFVFRVGTTNLWRSFDGQGNQASITGTYTWTLNTWMYMAWVRSGSTLTVYKDGVSLGSVTDSKTLSDSANGYAIGADRINGSIGTYLTGYLSGFRILVGTADSTVPTAPPTAIANTQLLCNFTNGAIFDNAAVADYETVGNAQISTSVKKYGTGSIAFDGTGDWLVSPASPNWDFGSGDFTVELWINPSATTAGEALVSKGNASSTGNEVWTLQWFGTNQLAFFSGGGLGTPVVNTGSVFATGNWYHVAVCRAAGVTKIFVNGTVQGTSTTSYTITAGGALYVGAGWFNPADRDISGYIDDLRISKGVARYTYNFTPPTAEFPNIGGTVTLTADPYYEYTTLLLPGNGTNGAQNNTFLDSSTNAFSITRNGNTTQGTFSPFSQTGWGNYFDGTGDYLSIADNAALNLGTGDFTLEGWVYITGFPGSNAVAMIAKWASGNYAYIVQILSPSTLRLYTGNSGSLSSFYDHTYTWQRNSWTHIAITRESSTLRFFVNGLLIGSNSSITQSLSNSSSFVLGQNLDGGGQDFTGYMSNVRVVKGTAVYTANFTPPTAPLTAITNTSLLTCQSNRFIDNSTNNFAITRNGDVSVQAFSPFNPTASWSAATYGGSGYFDGSGDYLSGIGTTSSFNFMHNSTALWTFECWAYLPSPSTNQYILDNCDGSTAQIGVLIGVESSKLYFAINRGASGTSVASGSSTDNVPANQWVHIAITYDQSLGSSNGKFYINGAASGTVNKTANAPSSSNASNAMRVGAFAAGSGPITGYLSNLRISNSVVYSSAFTPPTSPVTGGSLLLNFTNAGIYDATSKNDLETVGNAQISTTQSKFGGSSMYFDGTGDYLFAPSRAITSMSGDFTVEMWIYRNSGNNFFFTVGDSVGSSGFDLYIGNSGANLRLYSGNSVVIDNALTSVSFPTSTWTHVAVVRFSGSVRMYVAGFQAGSAWSSTSTFSGNIHVGAEFYNGSVTGTCNGYMQDVRVTNGIARYTSNFTPPTTAFLTL